MIRLLFIILIFMGVVNAQEKRYFIQLGSFQQLAVLEKTISTMPENLRSHIVVVNSNGWFVPFAYHTPKRVALARKLPEYRRYFPDAYINDSVYILRHRIVRNYTRTASKPKRYVAPVVQHYAPKNYVKKQRASSYNVAISQGDHTVPYTPTVTHPPVVALRSAPIPKPKVQKVDGEPKKYKHFSKQMLSGQHYYLAYKSTKDTPNLLVKVKFGNHQVQYQPIVGDMQLADANYIVDNNRLYMYAEQFTRDGAYSKIEAHKKEYILVSSWGEGKKLNTLRYYYKLNDAKSYLGESSSQDPLSKILEEEDNVEEW
ncbi:MAG: hypothetical protein K0U38_05125 [Epsilonproteobacteria bacterium]|nr:hypothetical protein [Campylobacterota bacterium]